MSRKKKNKKNQIKQDQYGLDDFSYNEYGSGEFRDAMNSAPQASAAKTRTERQDRAIEKRRKIFSDSGTDITPTNRRRLVVGFGFILLLIWGNIPVRKAMHICLLRASLVSFSR